MNDPCKCSDCGRDMVLGFIPDRTYGAVMESTWQEGPSETRKFLGMYAGVQFDPKRAKTLTAWRCPGCGLLKLYAK